MRTQSLIGTIMILLIAAANSYAGESALAAAKKIAGNYTGSWALYGVVDGNVVIKSRWTDVLTATEPVQDSGRAFVKVTDVMTFSDGSARTSKFEEGYLANADGAAGDRFFELNGSTVVFRKLTDNNWAFSTVPDENELRFLGFDPRTVLSASHITVKTTTLQGNTDTDHVTRVTTVQWKDAAGALMSMQFVSMNGSHTRTIE